MRKLTGVEETILDRALYLIGKTGSFNVPIRAIAKEANKEKGTFYDRKFLFYILL